MGLYVYPHVPPDTRTNFRATRSSSVLLSMQATDRASGTGNDTTSHKISRECLPPKKPSAPLPTTSQLGAIAAAAGAATTTPCGCAASTSSSSTSSRSRLLAIEQPGAPLYGRGRAVRETGQQGEIRTAMGR